MTGSPRSSAQYPRLADEVTRAYPLPAPRLLALLALAAPLFLISGAVGLAVDGLILALALVDLRQAPGGARLRVTRRTPARTTLGESVEIQYEVQNGTGVRTRVRLTDDLHGGLVRGDGGIAREANDRLEFVIEPWGRATVSHRVRAEARGTARVGEAHLRVLGPLGLVWRAERRLLEDVVRVQPGLLSERGRRLRGLRRRLALAGLHAAHQRDDRGEFESLREYVRGDDPRTIDWKATARRSTTIVRRYESERGQNIVLAIDAGRLMTERIDGRERLDHALPAALLLAETALAGGDRVGLLVFSDRVEHDLPPGRVRLAALADAMADVQARMVEPDYPTAFAHLSTRLRRRSLIVLFSDIIDPRASAALIAHAGRAAARHLPLVVALRNPELDAAAAAPAETEADVYRRIAAEELLQERALALAEMRRAGVLVADTEPRAAVATVLNRYLEVKRKGML